MATHEYGDCVYSTHGSMVEAMVWDWLIAGGLNVEVDADAFLAEGEADGWAYLTNALIADGWLELPERDETDEPDERAEVTRDDVLAAFAELRRIRVTEPEDDDR